MLDDHSKKGKNPIEVQSIQPRRLLHKKNKLTIGLELRWMSNPFKMDDKHHNQNARKFRTPSEWPQNSRYGAKRRYNRLKLRKILIFIKITKRIGISLLILTITIMITFWAKFAYVYNIPNNIQIDKLQNSQDVQAYIVYKSWWFGPPFFNLSSYNIQNSSNSETSLIIELNHYQDIITNPNEIIFAIRKNTNNTQ